MKPQKSPENEEVTPSKKKLKQARLPFKLLSEESPKTDVVQTRKRKLSVPDPQPVTKVGKITKENEITNDLVVISDDDSKDAEGKKVENNTKNLNPFVKLVDTAWKKKLQKSKTSRKKKSTLNNNVTGVSNDKNESYTSNDVVNNISTTSQSEITTDIENMDVDEPVDESLSKNTEPSEEVEKSKTNGTSDELKNAKLDGSENKQDISLEQSNDITIIEAGSDDDVESVNSNNDKEKNEAHSELENSEIECNTNSTKDMSVGTDKEKSPVTPRRTTRNKVNNSNKSLNTSQISTSDDVGSNPNTPKRATRSSSVIASEGDVSLNESANTNLTPKQAQKKLESAKKKEEREKKRQLEKEERARIKQEKEEQKKKEREEKEDARKREKEEKEEQKRKEREEKEKQKELEKKLKEEKEEQKRKEREEKEEQRKKEKEAREEEKRKKQEALELEKQEQEQKKKKAAEAFVSFFVPKQKSEKDQTTIGLSKNDMLSNFTIKADMRLAPAVRVTLADNKKKALDNFLQMQNVKDLYIKNIKNGDIKPLSSGKTWPLDEKDDDVMIIEDELPPIDGAGEVLDCDSVVREKLRPKLLSFHENRRPPYWGTWRKKSVHINPRQPFKMDEKQLDYEVDSDEEWEEEEGESIDGSAAGSDNEEGPDEYEVDNEVFVPHGYLSDEEATMDDDDVLSLSPETQKARLKNLEDEFESEMKKPTEKLKPRLYGLLWETADGGKPENCVDALWNYFSKMAMIMNDPTPFLQPSSETEGAEKKKVKKKKVPTDAEQKSPNAEKKKKPKAESKENKTKNEKQEKNQMGINAFLTKLKTT
ncbi:chromatin assembly factor 1 subunit A [Zerene cesonia]|uniref:chromatin assembly factor 1 subunit A n=1 Tax=Zerene cesonia TaxID=33412 RepID=UPI0018E4F919|nr:chromatin assembly factor 1 subunit A [Zerene cesonia]